MRMAIDMLSSKDFELCGLKKSIHRDAYMNDRNHASGAPRPGRE